jgi:hypothetical protein
VTKLDDIGRRALADDSNSACIRIGDQVWTQHKLAIDQDQEVKGSDLEALIIRLNSHNDDDGMCGITDWSLPTTAQLTRMAIDKTLPFTHKDSGNSYGDYWLIETEAAYRFVFDIRTLEKSSYSRSSSYEYSFRAVGTTSGEVQDALPVPAAPINGVVDDVNDIFSWDYVTGFTSATDYEFSINSGRDWNPVSSKPQAIGDVTLTIGAVQVRVKELADSHNSGQILSSTETYSGAAGCFGADASAEIAGICYSRHDNGKSWDDAKVFCEANNSNLVSKSHADFANLATELSLDASKKYWLLEPDSYPGYAYSLRKSGSSWRPGNYTHDSTQQSFICAK